MFCAFEFRRLVAFAFLSVILGKAEDPLLASGRRAAGLDGFGGVILLLTHGSHSRV